MKILVYSTDWCSDCVRSKRLLKREGLVFQEIDIEEVPHSEDEMKVLNGGSRKIPTILIESESGRDILIEPSDPDLKSALNRHRTNG
ncbi:hypothetical protein LBMAG21_09940 [Armatimonadota bacterium]|nr:hypothetical protein LBMAG21_09940 [Armatimonadota bacterium]